MLFSVARLTSKLLCAMNGCGEAWLGRRKVNGSLLCELRQHDNVNHIDILMFTGQRCHKFCFVIVNNYELKMVLVP